MADDMTPAGDAPPVPVPHGWAAERDGATLSLQSPDTAFWTLTAVPGSVSPEAAVEGALEALREEYGGDGPAGEVEVSPARGPAAAAGEVARDAAFFCLDSTATARARAFRAGGVTYVLFWQGLDRDVAKHGATLESLSRRAAAAAGAGAG